MAWYISILLGILCIVTTGILILFYWDIKKMTKQLKGITENFGSNELVRSNTHNKVLGPFIQQINQLILLFKQDQQAKEKVEKDLKDEITNLSHDLRTPLTSMKGFSDLLNDPSLSEPERKEYLHIIQQKVAQLMVMVDSFYEFSKLNSFDYQIHLDKQPLDRFIEDALVSLYHQISDNHLTVDMVEMNEIPILADDKATQRIVLNIMQNACQYAKSYIRINVVELADSIVLHIENDAKKLQTEKINRIFDRGFRLDDSRANGQLGLGLYIVHQLMEVQKGQVQIKASEDIFRVQLHFKKW